MIAPLGSLQSLTLSERSSMPSPRIPTSRRRYLVCYFILTASAHRKGLVRFWRDFETWERTLKLRLTLQEFRIDAFKPTFQTTVSWICLFIPIGHTSEHSVGCTPLLGR